MECTKICVEVHEFYESCRYHPEQILNSQGLLSYLDHKRRMQGSSCQIHLLLYFTSSKSWILKQYHEHSSSKL